MQQKYVQPLLVPSRLPLDWNGPAARAFTPFANGDLERPICELFLHAAGRHASRIALDDGTRQLTYAETAAEVLSLAARIARDTSPGELIGILLPTSAEFTIAMLACLSAGRLFVPLDLHYPRAWIENVIGDAALRAVIGRFDGEAGDLVPESVTRIDLSQRAETVAPGGWTPASADPDAPAFVLYTSGSTGKPKGIVNSQRNLLRRVQQYVDAAHISADDRFLPLSSECTIAGLRERMTALLTGATLHLADVQRAGARQILRRLQSDAITIVYGVPALLRSLAKLEGGEKPSKLRVLRVGGDAVLWSDVELLRGWLPESCLIELGYSSTEAPIMQWFVPREFPAEEIRVPIGYPLAGNNLAIVNDAGLPVAKGEAGELVVRSPYVALGRWVGGACRRDDFPADPENPSARILRTGDLARQRDDGLIELIGRKDRQLKIRGVRIEPAEIEAAMRLHPDVLDAAVFPRRSGDNIRLIAYAVLREGATTNSEGRLADFLRTRIAPQLQPSRIHVVESIPRLPSAKLDMAAVETLDKAMAAGEEQQSEIGSHEAAATDLEERLATIWCRVLDRASIDRKADFFDIGGDSLATLDLMFEIEEALGVELPVTMIYQAPTVAKLAAAIEAHDAGAFSPLVPIKEQGEGIPLFICHGVGGNVMELFPLGRRIESDGPVYAIQAKGLDGREEPNRRVADMATYYLDAIRRVQPEGPYLLAGYSSGGLIAFEMACRLRSEGLSVGLLALIDTQTNARQWPLFEWLRVLARRARHHGAEIARLSIREKTAYGAGAIAGFARRIAWRLGLNALDQQVQPAAHVPRALQGVFAATLEAVSQYRPGQYDGDALLLLSTIRDPLMAEPERIWPSHVRALEAHFVPGDHRSMIEGENGAVLARLLSERIARFKASLAGR